VRRSDLSVEAGRCGAVEGVRAVHLRAAVLEHLIPRRLLVLLAVSAVAALLVSAPAFALSQRGHVFSTTIGSKGHGAGQMTSPSGVAVNEATGDVYVADTKNNRVDRFSSAGTFIEAWGWGVADGKEEFERCTSVCVAGLPGNGEGQFLEPEAIAVDNSTEAGDPSKGDVYVGRVDSEVVTEEPIEKFSASGSYLGRIKVTSPVATGGLAVDATGAVWLYEYEQGEIEKFSNGEPNVALGTVILGEGALCGVPGFAVARKAEAFYLNHFEEGFEGCPEVAKPSTKVPGVTAKLSGAGETLISALDGENSTGVAVDQSTGQQSSGDVYVDNITQVAAFDSTGALIERFTAPEMTNGRGVAVNATTNTVYVAGATSGVIRVFVPAPPAAPQVDSVSSQNLTLTSSRLEALIDPHGADTHYYFQYGTVDCVASPSECTTVPAPPPGADLGAGFGDQPVSVEVTGLESGRTYFYRVVASNELGTAEAAQTAHTFTTLPNAAGLLPDGRAWELVSPPEKLGSEIEAIGGAGGPSGGIMESSEDGNSVTYVANGPIEKQPVGNVSPEGTQIYSTRSPSAWSSQAIVTPSSKGEGEAAGKPNEYQFFSSDLSVALLQPKRVFPLSKFQEPPLAGEEPEEAGLYIRRNLTCASSPSTCYQPLVTAANNLVHAEFGGEIGDVGTNDIPLGTPDMKHVVFRSEVALTSEKGAVPGLYEWSAEKTGAEQLQLVSILPSGGGGKCSQTEDVKLGNFVAQGTNARHAISDDGSRVIWGCEEGLGMYLRDMVKRQTVQINVPAEGVKKLKLEEREQLEEAHFQIASSDASKIFFTDTVPLTADSHLTATERGPADLYECEVQEVAGSLACVLKDLTSLPTFGQTADVVGTVMGAGEDGTSIYFVANGVLAPGATQGSCARPSRQGKPDPTAECNLYLDRYDATSKSWTLRFIARLSQEDSPDWNSTGGGSLGGLTARVSPNGRFLAFMSERSLTGYDNVDVKPEAGGARDEEVFLYDSGAEQLTCASCKTGSRPDGLLDKQSVNGGAGPQVDLPGVWRVQGGLEGEHWLAGSIPGWTPLEPNTAPYQSRYLSDSGRLFFNSNDALAPQDSNGTEDVYQYEPTAVGSCAAATGCVALISAGSSPLESSFMDASETGDDVFFITAGQLVPGDRDESYDVYDARVCTTASPCIESALTNPSACESEPSSDSCKPPATPAPSFSPPASATFSGPTSTATNGTLPSKEVKPVVKVKKLTKKQKLTRALKQCRHKYAHKKKKRSSCERQARRRYGVKKAGKSKRGGR
jgi:DNA-binding beta-propeller fold protein YncE